MLFRPYSLANKGRWHVYLSSASLVMDPYFRPATQSRVLNSPQQVTNRQKVRRCAPSTRFPYLILHGGPIQYKKLQYNTLQRTIMKVEGIVVYCTVVGLSLEFIVVYCIVQQPPAHTFVVYCIVQDPPEKYRIGHFVVQNLLQSVLNFGLQAVSKLVLVLYCIVL